MTTIVDTISNVLGTVSTTANAATTVVNAIARGATMLDTYVGDKQFEMRADSAAYRNEYSTLAVLQASLKVASKEREIQKQLDSDPDLAAKFAEVHQRIQLAVNKATAS